jgi:hypothetical protein
MGSDTDSANAVSLDIYNRSFAGKPVPGDQEKMSKDLPSLMTAVYLTGRGASKPCSIAKMFRQPEGS